MDSSKEAVRELRVGRGGNNGRVELVAVCRRMALENGTTLDLMLWEVVQGLMFWASKGDAACAKLVLTMFARDDSTAPPLEGVVGPATDAKIGGFVVSDEYAAELARVVGELDEPDDDDGDLARLLA